MGEQVARVPGRRGEAYDEVGRPERFEAGRPGTISTRVSGAFDNLGRAPAGTAFPLTLDVSGTTGGVATATVRVSYDDGATWASVPVSNATGTWVATVTHPANPASPFVPLRVVVTDQQGNSGGWTATRGVRAGRLAPAAAGAAAAAAT